MSIFIQIINSLQPERTIWYTKVPSSNGAWNFDPTMSSTYKTHVDSLCPSELERAACWKLSDGHFVERITNVSLYGRLRLQYSITIRSVGSVGTNSDQCQWYYGIDPIDHLYDKDCDNCTSISPSILLQKGETYHDISIALPDDTYYSDHLLLYFEAQGNIDCYINEIYLFGKLWFNPTDQPTPEPTKAPINYTTPEPTKYPSTPAPNESEENQGNSGPSISSGAIAGSIIAGFIIACCIVFICARGRCIRGPYFRSFNTTAHGPDLSEDRFRYLFRC